MSSLVAFLLAISLLFGPVTTSRPADGIALGRGDHFGPADPQGVGQAEDAPDADMAAIREAQGWTPAQAAAYEASRVALDSVAGHIASSAPEQFVGSVLDDDPTKPPKVFVKGQAEADVRTLADQLGVVLVEDQPLSLDELDARLAVIQDAASPVGLDFAAWTDIEHGGAITLVVARGSDPSLDHAILDQAFEGLPPEIVDEISVLWEDGPIVVPQGAFGGMELQEQGGFECTSGWTVRRIADGAPGVTGAAHCFFMDQIDHPGHGIHALVFQAEHTGAWGEVEWYTTYENEADDFYVDANNVRDVDSVEPRAGISINEFICVYGRFTNQRNCTLKVANPNVICGAAQKMVQMNGSVTMGGDSGGGWSLYNTAYGSHFGLCGGKSSFSVADLFDEALGVAVAVT